MIKIKPVISVCGKGGVGKTVFSALLSRVLIEEGLKPLLLVDADPVGGLTSAIGEKTAKTLAGVKEQFINDARTGGKTGAMEAADQLDYYILNALVEHNNYSFLAMGHTTEKGCFCPANKLLRSSIDQIISAFAGVVIDAEAGIEQINREVTRTVNKVFVVVDASQRSIDTLKVISGMVNPSQIEVVVNRTSLISVFKMPEGFNIAGIIPENDELKQFDRDGRSLWLLPENNEALASVRNIVKNLEINSN